MNFLIFKDFNGIFSNFSEFILDLFGFKKNKNIKFLSRADMVADAMRSDMTPHDNVYMCQCARV